MDLLYTRVAPAPDVLTRTQQHMHRTGCDNTSAYCGITNPRGAEVSARLTAGAQTARSLEDDNLLGLNGLRATLWGAVVSARLNGLRAALSLHSQPPAYLLQPSEACIQPPALVLHAFMQALASHAFSQLLSPACIQPPAIVRGSVA